jgi:hypothetical protein
LKLIDFRSDGKAHNLCLITGGDDQALVLTHISIPDWNADVRLNSPPSVKHWKFVFSNCDCLSSPPGYM